MEKSKEKFPSRNWIIFLLYWHAEDSEGFEHLPLLHCRKSYAKETKIVNKKNIFVANWRVNRQLATCGKLGPAVTQLVPSTNVHTVAAVFVIDDWAGPKA